MDGEFDMPTITLTIPESLDKKLRRLPELNKSELFVKVLKKKLDILEQLEEIEKDIPVDILLKIAEGSKADSLEFGRQMFFEWIKEDNNSRYIFAISNISDDESIFDNLNKVTKKSLPFHIYKEEFEEEIGAIFIKEEFARGFVLAARSTVSLLKETE